MDLKRITNQPGERVAYLEKADHNDHSYHSESHLRVLDHTAKTPILIDGHLAFRHLNRGQNAAFLDGHVNKVTYDQAWREFAIHEGNGKYKWYDHLEK